MSWDLCLVAFVVTLVLTVAIMVAVDRRLGPRCIVCGRHDKTGKALIRCDHCGKTFCRANLDELAIADLKQKIELPEERTGHGAVIDLYGVPKHLCNYCLERL